MASLNLKEIFPDLADLTEEEIMMIQESHLSELQKKVSGGKTGGDGSWCSLQVFHNQLAVDEALARALQDNADWSDYEPSGYGTTRATHEVGQGAWINHQGMDEEEALAKAVADSLRVSGNGYSYQGAMGVSGINFMGTDDIDPDSMTYEELNSLGDAMGKESKGVSVDFISQLPMFTFKAGGGKRSSSKKKIQEGAECVICRTEYENGDKLNALPCAHQFHTDCITPWLKDNKQCPICQKEVQQEAQSSSHLG